MSDKNEPDRTGARTMSSMEPCPFCGGEAKWVEDTGAFDTPFGLVVDHAPKCFLSLHMNPNEWEARWNTRAPIPVTDEMVERAMVAKCIELIREVQQDFLSPEYTTGQPFNSFQERFACGRVIERLEQEYGLGTTEQRALLGKPAITAALGGGNG